MSVLVAVPERFGLPRVPSSRMTCTRCSASVWVSRRANLDDETIDGILCVVCAMAVVKPGDLIEPAPWALDDLAQLLREDEP